jgi:hypothetical protein
MSPPGQPVEPVMILRERAPVALTLEVKLRLLEG